MQYPRFECCLKKILIWKIIGVIAGIVGIVGDAIIVWRVTVWYEGK